MCVCVCVADWEHQGVRRQLSVSSDSKLLDEDIREEARVILRPKKPPRPKSEVFLNKAQDPNRRRTKRFSAFGVSTLYLHSQHKSSVVSLRRITVGKTTFVNSQHFLLLFQNFLHNTFAVIAITGILKIEEML